MFYVVARPTPQASSEKLWMKVLGTLNEYQARLFVAERAVDLGRGGISHLARLTSMSRVTITAAHSLPAGCSLPDLEVTDPNFSFAGAVDFLHPTLRRLDSREARSDALDFDTERRNERWTLAPGLSADFGFGPTRHARNVHGYG